MIRVSGDKAIDIVSGIFSRSLEQALPNTVHYGTIVDEDSHIIDEVLVAVFRNPHSYTGEDSVEISCHGSRYIVNRILEILIKNGCRALRRFKVQKRPVYIP